jgi:serine/threonine protein kinase/Tol biopolymer transport system component
MTIECPKCRYENTDTAHFCSNCAAPLPNKKDAVPTKTLETSKEELTTGSIFAGRYQIIEELGKGGMGRIYKAYDKEIKENIALKLLNPEISVDKKTIERFRNEIKLARKIAHKRVGRMFDLGNAEGIYYIAMEYVPGQDLRGLIRQTGKLTIETTLSIIKQVCEGLEEAHKLGVVHRDLKPGNIMIDKEGNVRIMDFGIARSLKTKGLTGTGVMIGTPEYMSPEQSEAKEIDLRSDIYSLGIILYEMLTGRVPFEGDTPLSIAMKHKSEDFTAPKILNPRIPEGLNNLILKCLEKNRADRYQSVEEVSRDIDGIEKTIPLAERVVPRKKPVTSREITVKIRRKTVLIYSFLIIILLVIGAYFLFHKGRAEMDIKPGTIQQITHEPGLEIDPDISPDGKMVAFATGPLGRTRIVVRQVSDGRPIEVAQDFEGNQRWPQWSPDGNQIAFFSGGSIYVVQALGGIPRRIIEGTSDSSAYSPSWSPDGKRIAYLQGGAIHIFHTDTGDAEKVAEVKEAYCLSWSPDGTKMAFVSGNLAFVFSALELPEARFPYIGNKAPSSIHVLSLSKGSSFQVTSDDCLNTSPVWTPDGKHLLFVSNRDGARDIYVMPLSSSGEPQTPPAHLTTGIGAHTIGISRDGKKLVCSVFNYTANLWSIEIPEERTLPISKAEQITHGNQIIESVSVSPDGLWLAYDSDLTGRSGLYRKPTAGGESILLTPQPSDDFAPRWSPDGETILFHSFKAGNRDIYCISNDGGPAQLLIDGPSHELTPDWSADGSKISFVSDRTGQWEIYVVSKEEKGWGEPEQLTFEGGSYARWSPVEDSIAFIIGDSLKVLSLDDRRIRTLVQSQNIPGSISHTSCSWSPDGRTVYFQAMDEQGIGCIWSVPAEGGEPELKIVSDDPNLRLALYTFGADDERFYFSMRNRESNVLIMDLLSRK